jgi:plasmid replication initiation protein
MNAIMDRVNNGIVCQSNKLVEARFSLTLNEQKLIIMMVSLISLNDKDFKDYEIRVADFAGLLKIKNKNIYSEIKDLLLRLTSRTLFIKEETGFLVASWVSSARYIEASGIIQLSFDKKLKPYLLELKSEFTKLNLFTVVQFKSTYTIRIYMLLKQYEKLKVREFDLLDLRQKLGMKEGIYPEFRSFRERVINQAKKELDKKDKDGSFISDITFIFKPIKQGRRIVRLRFLIVKNKKYKPQKIDTHTKFSVIHNNLKKSKEFHLLIELGITEKKVLDVLDKYDSEIIKEKLALTKEEERNNPSGFFLKALEHDYKSTKNTPHNQTKILIIPNISDGTQLQNWAISNGLPAAPAGLDTYQYRQMLQNKVERMRMEEERKT